MAGRSWLSRFSATEPRGRTPLMLRCGTTFCWLFFAFVRFLFAMSRRRYNEGVQLEPTLQHTNNNLVVINEHMHNTTYSDSTRGLTGLAIWDDMIWQLCNVLASTMPYNNTLHHTQMIYAMHHLTPSPMEHMTLLATVG